MDIPANVVWIFFILLIGGAVWLLCYLNWRENGLLKIKWEMKGGGHVKCPCCFGDQVHNLTNPKESIDEMRSRDGGKYQTAANWVNCAPCGGLGYVMKGPYEYTGWYRGKCAGA